MRLVVLIAVAPATAYAGPIDDLAVGDWLEVPNSHMRDVAHDWSPDSTPGNVAGVMTAWCGGDFDTIGERLLVRGGGHGDYGGNEIYGCDLDTINDQPGTNPWQKLSEPDARDALDSDCSNPDNLTDNDLPRAQHSYNRLAFLPALNALCDTGGSVGYTFCPAERQLDCFDFDDGTWHLAITDPAESAGTASFGAVHPITGHWWLQGGSGSGILGHYDPVANTWEYGHYDNVPGSTAMYMGVAIDPTRDLFVAVGEGDFYAMDLATFQVGVTELTDDRDGFDYARTTTGGDAVVNAPAPGIAYDPVDDRIVGWAGGASVYLLDLDTWAWTSYVAGGTPPGAPASNGTYGRFRYSPRYNVFVVVSSVDQNVYLLRLTDGAGPPDTTAPAAPTGLVVQ